MCADAAKQEFADLTPSLGKDVAEGNPYWAQLCQAVRSFGIWQVEQYRFTTAITGQRVMDDEYSIRQRRSYYFALKVVLSFVPVMADRKSVV